MSHEAAGQNGGDDWAESMVNDIFEHAQLDAGCPSVENQILRDIAAEADGILGLTAGETVTVSFAGRDMRVRTLIDTPFGMLSERFDFDNQHDERELLFICGTFFWAPKEEPVFTYMASEQQYWPETADANHYENYFEAFPSLIANRSILKGGMLAIRETFSPQEMKTYGMHPRDFADAHFWHANILDSGETELSRAVPKVVTLLSPTLDVTTSAGL